MRIGIIAEGKGDQAVLTNILKGKLGIDKDDITYLRPELYLDETDLSSYRQMKPEEYSNWSLVKEDCLKRTKIQDFLDNQVLEEKAMVIHIDSDMAEAEGYDLKKPEKKNNSDYSTELRNIIKDKINEWLEHNFQENIHFAIAIEEIEAWVLTIYMDNIKDTCIYNDPKKEFESIKLKKFSKNKLKEIEENTTFDKYLILSADFRKEKQLKKYAKLNQSLDDFCTSLENVI
jgi:hypothetical protein